MAGLRQNYYVQMRREQARKATHLIVGTYAVQA